MKRLLVYVFAVVLLGSCGKNGEYENYHPNGKLSDWILYENDLELHAKRYDTSGNMITEAKSMIANSPELGEYAYTYFQKNYRDGILTGFVETTQDDNPITMRMAHFNKNGQKEGTWMWLCNDKYQMSQDFGANAINHDLMYKDIQDAVMEYKMDGWGFAEEDLDSNELETCKVDDIFEDILKEQANLILKKMMTP